MNSKAEFVLILGTLALAAWALFKGNQVVTTEKVVEVAKPYMVEVPTAIVTPQNTYNLYNVEAGMQSGAVTVQSPIASVTGGASKVEGADSGEDFERFLAQSYAQSATKSVYNNGANERVQFPR